MVIVLAMTLAGAGIARAANLELPVPRVTIYPGDTISADQLTDRAFIAQTVTRSSVFDDRQALVGKVARRTLLPGQPVPVNAIRDPYLVNQGKSSLVVFENGGLTITTQAIALQNGVAGDVVTLRNPDSGVVIQGTVERDGSVRLGGQ
ncbi:MAG: flagellar basal body P-ring formation protein FlgA [Hyphomonadaceae bacterium]|nr:flagellar basal body P-ring formation protein FlgA [Hyphomonadaceae bacterium]